MKETGSKPLKREDLDSDVSLIPGFNKKLKFQLALGTSCPQVLLAHGKS